MMIIKKMSLLLFALLFTLTGCKEEEKIQVLKPQIGNMIIKMRQPALMYRSENHLLVTDTGNNVIYQIEDGKKKIYSGKISKEDIYGFPKNEYQDGTNDEAKYGDPYGITKFLSGYAITDRANNRIRYITEEGVKTIAGTGEAGLLDGKGTESQFHSPAGITTDDDGNLYIADSLNHCIRKMDPQGNVSIYAGGEKGYLDGDRLKAQFHTPIGIYYENDLLYITDSENQRIRKIDLKNGKVETVAGNAAYYEDSELYAGGFSDGTVEVAQFDHPTGIIKHGDSIYIADTGNSAVRQIKDGIVTTIMQIEDEDVSIYPAKPVGLAIEGDTLYISDSFAGLLYSLTGIE